jgi:hypothetical protein
MTPLSWGFSISSPVSCSFSGAERFTDRAIWDSRAVRRFRRRWLVRVRRESYLIGGVLNLKRLAKHLGPVVQPT